MVRRHVLAALAEGIRCGDEDVARALLERVDGLVRRAAQRRLSRTLIDAALAANEFASAADREAARHVMRVAALAVARVSVGDARDRVCVAEAYAVLPPVRAARRPVASIAVTTTSAVVTIAIVVAVLVGGRKPRAVPVHAGSPPVVTGAFATGGVPRPDAELERVIADDLSRLVAEADLARTSGRRDATRAVRLDRLRAEPALQAHGPALAAAWTELLATLDSWAGVPRSSTSTDKYAHELRDKVRAMSDQLAAIGVGYYLEGDVVTVHHHARAVVYTYRVEDVVYVTTGGVPRRVLSLRRIDRIHLTRNLMGMQSEDLGDPVLLLDQIDLHVVRRILPVLAPGAPYNLVLVNDGEDDPWAQTQTAQELALRAGAKVRDELAAALGRNAPRAGEVATKLAERTRILDGWRADLARKKLRLSYSFQLFVPEALLAGVEDHVDANEHARVRQLDIDLAELEAPRIEAACRALVAASIRRHEAQHGFDNGRGEPLAYPDALGEILGEPLDGYGEPRRAVERARAELSAYLSQIANDPLTPHMALWNVAHHAFTASMTGTPESIAGALIVEGLARHMDIRAIGPVIQPSLIVDRDRLALLARPLARLTGDQLRALAHGLWDELYDEPVTTIVD